MAITLSTAARNAAVDGVTALLDGSPSGTITGHTSGDAEAFRVGFGNTAFGDAASGVCTANTMTADDSAAGGDITGGYHRVNDGADAEIWRGSVGTSGADLNLSSLNIAATDKVEISSYTITQPAS